VSIIDDFVFFMWIEAPISAGQGIEAVHTKPESRIATAIGK
jgi:hypothetical protein